MGASKVVFLSGLYIIIGLYATGIRKADSNVRQVAEFSATRDQATEIAKTGVQFVINDLATHEGGGYKPSASNLTVGDGTVTYQVTDRNATVANMTSTGTLNGREATLVAQIQYVGTKTLKVKGKDLRWDRWKIVKMYVQPIPRDQS